MKKFLTILGLLTLAQWVFVGLLYGFLEVQGTNSPETMAKLHDRPLVGGFFPAVTLKTKEDKERAYGDEVRLKVLEAKEYYKLPESVNHEELKELLVFLRAKKDELAERERQLEDQTIEVRNLIDELDTREKKLGEERSQLEMVAAEVKLAKAEKKTEERNLAKKQANRARVNNKQMAKWFNEMEPAEAARRILREAVENETELERQERYRDAAILLSMMDGEKASQVIALIEPVEWVRIEAEKRRMGTKEEQKLDDKK